MASSLRLPFALSLLLAATACATPSTDSGTPAPAAPVASEPVETAPPAQEPAMTCQADKGQFAVGQIADEALVAKAKAETTSERVRVIKPNMAVTMDYREDRLNLDVDADNRVLSVRCG